MVGLVRISRAGGGLDKAREAAATGAQGVSANVGLLKQIASENISGQYNHATGRDMTQEQYEAQVDQYNTTAVDRQPPAQDGQGNMEVMNKVVMDGQSLPGLD